MHRPDKPPSSGAGNESGMECAVCGVTLNETLACDDFLTTFGFMANKVNTLTV